MILASASPRRKALLEQIGLEFEVICADTDEAFKRGISIKRNVQEIACSKAKNAALKAGDNCVVIGADTVVCVGGEILGKPADENSAREMLERLSGRVHFVYTGYAVLDKDGGGIYTGCEKTAVTFGLLTQREILEYIKTGEPFDKAGAYAVQGRGALFIKKIKGDYNNVVGLPLYKLCKTIKKIKGVQLCF